jgi:NAD-dependent deacetylase
MAAIVTQNIDGLHQASGVPAERVIELHGNATYAACLDCGRRYELDWVREIFAIDEQLPLCTACAGMIKTATISFGQAMPEREMERAREATLGADLFIVLGSSLVVYPAAGFPIMAKRNGARLVIVNREPTDQDEMADLVIHAERARAALLERQQSSLSATAHPFSRPGRRREAQRPAGVGPQREATPVQGDWGGRAAGAP